MEIAQRVVQEVGSESVIDTVDPKEVYGPMYDEAWDKIPDSSKLRRKLGWYPKWSIDEIIADVASYWRAKND